MTGRPTTYCEEMAERICDLVSLNTCGYRKLEKIYPDLPNESTVRLWRMKNPTFSVRYAQAKIFQAEILAEECLEISDDSRNDWVESLSEENGSGLKFNAEHVNRSRLRIDTRKWTAAKLAPKVYGDIKHIEELTTQNASIKAELMELRAKLDAQNKKEY